MCGKNNHGRLAAQPSRQHFFIPLEKRVLGDPARSRASYFVWFFQETFTQAKIYARQGNILIKILSSLEELTVYWGRSTCKLTHTSVGEMLPYDSLGHAMG